MRVLVLGFNSYNFPDKQQPGRQVVGNSVTYTTGQSKQTDAGSFVEVADIKGNSEQVMRSIHTAPAIYEIEQSVDVARNGKATLKIVSAKFIAEYDLAQKLAEVLEEQDIPLQKVG